MRRILIREDHFSLHCSDPRSEIKLVFNKIPQSSDQTTQVQFHFVTGGSVQERVENNSLPILIFLIFLISLIFSALFSVRSVKVYLYVCESVSQLGDTD